MDADKREETTHEELSRLAGGRSPGLPAEFLAFLLDSKKWWLTPILLVLLVLGTLVWLAGPPLAPLIYTLF